VSKTKYYKLRTNEEGPSRWLYYKNEGYTWYYYSPQDKQWYRISGQPYTQKEGKEVLQEMSEEEAFMELL